MIGLQIIEEILHLDVYGFGGVAANKDHAGTAFKLMDRMWPIVKGKALKHKGLNIWIYEDGHKVFAGVELEDSPESDTGLELNRIMLNKYAYYKHIGPYSLLGQSGNNMRSELTRRGFVTGLPFIEIYGHWTDDESKLETELLIALK